MFLLEFEADFARFLSFDIMFIYYRSIQDIVAAYMEDSKTK